MRAPRVLYLSRTRSRLPLEEGVERKWELLGRRPDLRLLATDANAAGGAALPFKHPRRKVSGAATSAQLEALFADWETTLATIDFFKTRQPDHVMRSWRGGPFPAAPAGPAVPAPIGAPPAVNYNGLRDLGSYMNNCSAGNYGALSERELAHCIGDLWDQPGRGQATFRLPKEPDSVWKRQKEKEKAPAPPGEHECKQGSLNSNLGLPCFDFGH